MNDTAAGGPELLAALDVVEKLLLDRASAGELSLSDRERAQIEDLLPKLAALTGAAEALRASDHFLGANLREARLDLVWQWELERAALTGSLRAGAGQLLANTIAELSACRMLLNHSPVEAIQPGLKALEEELRVELAEFQALLCDLNSPLHLLPDLGLYACLRLYAKGCAHRYGTDVTLLHDQAPLSMPQKLQVVVYRLIQMAVKQARAWRGASIVEVHLVLQEDGLLIQVTDNGNNDVPRIEWQSVLLDMDRLAELVGAQVTRKTLENGSTRLICRVPTAL